MESLRPATAAELAASELSSEQLQQLQINVGRALYSIELKAILALLRSNGMGSLAELLNQSNGDLFGAEFSCSVASSAKSLTTLNETDIEDSALNFHASDSIHYRIQAKLKSGYTGINLSILSDEKTMDSMPLSLDLFSKQETETAPSLSNKSSQEIPFEQPENLKAVARELINAPASRQRLYPKTSGETSNISIQTFQLDGQKRAISLAGNPAHFLPNEVEKSLLGEATESILKIAALGYQSTSISMTLIVHKNNIDQLTTYASKCITQLLKISQTLHIPIGSVTIGLLCEKTEVEPFCMVATAGLQPPEVDEVTASFQSKGDLIFLLGDNHEDIKGSLYAEINKLPKDVPFVQLSKTKALHSVLNRLTNASIINSACICATGGIYLSLVELSLEKRLGFDIVTDAEIREDAFLFGEANGRAIVTVNEDNEDDFIEFMMNSGVTFTLLGHVTQGKMVIDDEHFGFSKDVVEQLKK